MPAVDSSAIAGLVLGVAVFLVDLLLLFWLWRERRGRPIDQSLEDRNHFNRQDLRRVLVVIVLAILSGALAFGTRIPSMAAGKPNPKFVQLWAGVIALILVLSILAMVDWISIRFYARRRRMELLEEGVGLIEQQRRAKQTSRSHSAEQNGHHDQPLP